MLTPLAFLLHPFRHIQRDRPERSKNFARAGLRCVVHVVKMLSLITLLRNRGQSVIVMIAMLTPLAAL
jgi:hypothetical protein